MHGTPFRIDVRPQLPARLARLAELAADLWYSWHRPTRTLFAHAPTPQRMLELAGFRVLTAADGHSALALYGEQRDTIDVVLLDMTMPGLDGRDTYRELARIRPDVRVVLTSGYSEQEAFSEWGGQGLAGFLQKPYRVPDLVSILLQAQAKRAR